MSCDRYDKYHLIAPDKLVTRQPGKAAICAASPSFGNSTQRLRPEEASYSVNGNN
jgi:hypothetical protein